LLISITVAHEVSAWGKTPGMGILACITPETFPPLESKTVSRIRTILRRRHLMHHGRIRGFIHRVTKPAGIPSVTFTP